MFLSRQLIRQSRCIPRVVTQRRLLSENATSPNVARLVGEIVKLNLLEVSELVQELNTRLNLPDTPMGMPMGMPMMAAGSAPAAGAAAAAEAEAEPVAAVKPIVNIQLDSVDAAAKIKVIKEVKTITGLGLKEAKAAVEGAPGIIMNDIKREEAEAIVKTLADLGAKASLV